MATTMQCDIVSAEKSIFTGAVEMVVAAGSLGDLRSEERRVGKECER